MGKTEPTYPLLSGIQFPADLRQLSEEQLQQVCTELRDFIIDVVSVKGGHFGASLGVVINWCGMWATKRTATRSSPDGAIPSTPTASTKD